MTPDQDKERLRGRGRALRHQRNAGDAAERIKVNALSVIDGLVMVPGPDAVAGYWPMDGEADPRPLLEDLSARGILCALPVVVRYHAALEFRAWSPGDALVTGLHGIRQPVAGVPSVIPRVVLVPLVAFDRAGHRLGMGGGYYDRTLDALRSSGQIYAIGIAYEAQKVDSLPALDHDQPLDWVVTEKRAMRFGEGGR